ncbi:bifunctional lysylphosphatidylglycerol flippase/synthetase MprF [Robiginitomaculum antarcticum]|uniref:bifunctional lysylphosphatidylglycerol flippase/synthetase MprF n=1 Tax=Robiginitomaculum antarcticum TaxID=437507 RepID=UPI00036903D3|nr:bifunctional lysylphosphatidylglycerol flippase/synthetase MprF [Robiginitomaculum antarcticum]
MSRRMALFGDEAIMPMIPDMPGALRPQTPDKAARPFALSPRQVLTVAVGLLMFGLAIAFIHNEIKAFSFDHIAGALSSISPIHIAFALVMTLVSFSAVAFYDFFALKYTERGLPLRQTAMASVLAYAISNSLGFSALTGNAVRYRLYTAWGLAAVDVAVIALITALFMGLSGLSLASAGLLLEPGVFERVFHLSPALTYALGIAGAASIAAALVYLRAGGETRSVFNISFNRPPASLMARQWAAGIVDWAAAAAVLYILLLPSNPEFSFVAFVPLFVAAHYAGAASGLPGGIGVFEAIILLLIPTGDVVFVAAALIAYRAIYYFLPLLIAALVLGFRSTAKSKDRLLKGGERTIDFFEGVAPITYALLSFMTGAALLIGAALPLTLAPLDWASRLLPPAIMSLSHILASAAGTMLLLSSFGLRRRLQSAWLTTVIMLILGALFTFLKGGDLRGALILLLLSAALFLSRAAFYRKGQLGAVRLTLPRLGALLAAGGFALWIGFYANMDSVYSHKLWLNFNADADASRFLRAALIAGLIFAAYFVRRLFAPAPRLDSAEPPAQIMARVQEIIAKAQGAGAEANLALMGDKQFLFSESGNSFIMYGIKGRNWVAMGEPVGLAAERKDLIWTFRQLADSWDGWPSFYSVRDDNLTDFIDVGLTVQKIGELALVPIEGYTLDGPAKARFRQAKSRAVREGCSFEIIYPARDSADMESLRAVSDAWLDMHQGREKGFSLGRFDANVFDGKPVAVVRKDGDIVAFANLWTTADKRELSLDLMRYKDVGVNAMMEFLFAEVMLWGAAEGYRYFSLGMAPLAGLDARKLAPFMSKLGAMVYKYGGRFYGFEGLRAFKSKFNPQWEPVYLAAPSRMVMPLALGNLALLSGGGILGIIQRG